MKSNHYITNELKKRVPMILAIFAALAMLALNLAVKEPVLEPDTVHPFANARVSWEQTFHAGPWGGAE